MKKKMVKCFDPSGQLRAIGRLTAGNMYAMDVKPLSGSLQACQISCQPSLDLWHRRLAHCNLRKVQKAVNWNGDLPNGFSCVGCIHGKAHRLPFTSDGKKRELKPGLLVHMDIVGPMRETSVSGCKYFLLIKDDHSGFMSFYPMKLKSDTLDCFKQFLLDWNKIAKENKVKRIRSDNGTEFLSSDFQAFLSASSIGHETSTPYSPEQNGYIERSVRTVSEAARSMIHEAALPQYLWAEACNTAVYILNRLPLVDSDHSPFELVTGESPKLNYIRVFGSKAFVHIRDGARGKFDKKAEEMILVGYDAGKKAYRCFDRSSRKLTISRDVTIIEPTSVNEVDLPATQQWFDSEETTSSTRQPSDSEERNETLSQEESLVEGVISSSRDGQPASAQLESKPASKPAKRGRSKVPEFAEERKGSLRQKLPDPNYVPFKVNFPYHPVVNVVSSVQLPCPETYKQAMDSPEKEKWIEAMKLLSFQLMNNWQTS